MDELLTINQVAKILKINSSSVYRLIHSHKLKALKLGALKVRLATLQKFLADIEAEQNGSEQNGTNNFNRTAL